MKVEVNLTEEQFNELIATKSLTLKIDVENCNIESIPVITIWPDTKGYKPAEVLIKRLRKSNLKPSELPYLSRQRVARLVRTNKTGYELTMGSGTWKKVKQVEEIFGITFQNFTLPSSKIQEKVLDAFKATVSTFKGRANEEEGIEDFLNIVYQPIPPHKNWNIPFDVNIYEDLGYHVRNFLFGRHGVYNEIDLKTVLYLDIPIGLRPRDEFEQFLDEFFNFN